MPLPSDLPTSGRRFGPSTMRAMARMTMSSIGPTFGIRSPGRSRVRVDPTRARPPPAPGRLPPVLGVEVLDLLHGLRVDAARQVLPAVVAESGSDVALVEIAGDADGDRRDRAR